MTHVPSLFNDDSSGDNEPDPTTSPALPAPAPSGESRAKRSSSRDGASSERKPKQSVEIVSTPRHRIIRASAGSGKTFQLSNQYISRLRSAAPDRILATTFTRKAAGEILERILIRLARAGLHDEHLASLAPFVGAPPLRFTEALRLLGGLTRNLHRLRIGTLDSFFSKLASSFTLELGFPPGWRMLEETEDQALRNQAIEMMLRQETTQDVVQLMHLLAKGNAARGVHSLISDAISNYYNTYLATDELAWEPFPLVRFLPKEEFDEALERLAALRFDAPSWEDARQKDVRRAIDRDWGQFLKTGLGGKIASGDATYYRKAIPEEVVEVYRPLLAQARAAMIVPWADQTRAVRALLDRFHRSYELLKRERRGYRFDDIARRLGERLSNASAGSLAYRLDAGIDHLLLDEFQDTSPVQWAVLRPFANAVVSGDDTSFFCVGDSKQAIYGWRGGVAEIFDAIQKELASVAVESLDRSFRSSPVVIDTVNRVFEGLPRHSNLEHLEPAVRKFSKQFPAHKTARDHKGYARLETPPAPPDDEGQVDRGVLLAFAARRVAELFHECPGASIGVLVRRNETVGRMVHQLQGLGIPASEEGGNPLVDSAAVQLLLSLLKVADHPGHTIARFHVAQSPLGPPLEFPDHADDLAADRLATEIRSRLLRDGYSRTMYDLALLLMPTCGPRDARRLRQLVDLAGAYEAQVSLRPHDFVDYVESQKVQDPSQDRVRVMNVHQAKGLEFDIVVLPELDSEFSPRSPSHVYDLPSPMEPPSRVMLYRDRVHVDLLPAALQDVFAESEARETTEALSVLYVMLTRAIHALYMIVLPRPNERSLPKTYAGLIRASLTDGTAPAPGTVLFETGEADWYRQTHPADSAVPPESVALASTAAEDPVHSDASSNEETVQITFAPMEGGRLRGRQRISPSKAGHQPERVRLSSVLDRGTAATLDRGVLFHKWFEIVQWLDEGRPRDDTLRSIAQRHGAARGEVGRLVSQFHAMLRAPALAAVLSRPTYTPAPDLPLGPDILRELAEGPLELDVAVERRFTVVDEQTGNVIAGSIDRLVLLRRNNRVLAADILDFKTDALVDGEASVADKVDAYRQQLHLYRRAVARIYGLAATRICARLVFLHSGRVETVD